MQFSTILHDSRGIFHASKNVHEVGLIDWDEVKILDAIHPASGDVSELCYSHYMLSDQNQRTRMKLLVKMSIM